MSLRRALEPQRIAFWLAVLSGACGAAFLVYGIFARSYGIVEAEMLFEASRIEKGLPLYVDPSLGAWEMGAPPSRYYVLYTPVWPWILAHLGPSSLLGMRLAGRVLSASLGFGALAVVVAYAERRNRLVVATGALLSLGLYLLVREGGVATADTLAVTLSALGLVRMSVKGKLDVISAMLLALAPLVKPSVLGGPIGAVVAHVIVTRKAGARSMLAPLAAGGAVGLALVAVFHVASSGEWLRHIVRGTGQPLSLERWAQEFGSRAFLLGLPHAVVFAVAVHRRASLVATVPLAASTLFATFAMAKHGSATNYWLEPTMAALVTLGALPSRRPSRVEGALPYLAVAFAAAVAVTSLPVFARAKADYDGWRAFVDALKTACPLADGEVMMASDTRLEMELNGRVIIPAWQNSYLVRTGRFPLAAWRDDLRRKEVRWLVHTEDYLDPVPERIDGITEVSAYRKELRDVVDESFVFDRRIGVVLIFRRR